VNLEIERRFLVNESNLNLPKDKKRIKQAYLLSDSKQALRVRMIGSDYFLTYKYKKSGINRYEFEYPISKEDGEKLISLSDAIIIVKDRYYITFDDHLWEIDVFYGENKGLIIAEIELIDENENVSLPNWIGKEISTDEKYFNFNLSKVPFSVW
jgi:CYTH domain-containing protein